MAADTVEVSDPADKLIPASDLLTHLNRLIQVVLQHNTSDKIIAHDLNTVQIIERFISDPGTTALYIQRRKEDGAPFIHTLHLDLLADTSIVATLAVIKGLPTISTALPLQQQLQILNLPVNNDVRGSQTYEPIHNLMSFAIIPYFDLVSIAANDNSGKAIGEIRQGVPLAKKQMADLELSLLHLQQNVQIPYVRLLPHPLVQQCLVDAAEQNTRPTISSLKHPEVLEDSMLMNAIQATTVTWRQNIKQLAERDRDPTSGSATQEVDFWLNMDNVINDLDQQLKSDAVILTFDMLAAAKRMGANAAMMMQDTGLRAIKDRVKSYSLLMRDFPLNDLLSATNLEKASEAVLQIFGHLNRRIRSVPYPIARAIPFVEAITDDIDSQIHSLLKGKRLMQLDYPSFSSLIDEANAVFEAYDDQVKDFITTSRDVLRKRNEKFLVMKINSRHGKTQERLAYLHRFRSLHEQLRSSVSSILGSPAFVSATDSDFADFKGSDALREMAAAYDHFMTIDVLNVSEEGTTSLTIAENIYNERVANVENVIIQLLRGRLAATTTASEMFRVLAIFNTLFVRPKVRGAVQEYQRKLIDGVKVELSRLQDRHKQQFMGSGAHQMSSLRDMPPVSGAIRWSRQIDTHLESQLQKVEAILGEGWNLHAEGQKLYSESSVLRAKLDTRPLFENWLAEIKSRDTQVRGIILAVVRNRAFNNRLELSVLFDQESVTLFKEVRNLLYLGFTIPHQVNTSAKAAKSIYPYAVSLMEGVNTLSQVQFLISEISDSNVLLAEFQVRVQEQIALSTSFTWEDFREETGRHRRATAFVLDFCSTVETLQLRVQTLIFAEASIAKSLEALKICAYDASDLNQHIKSIQGIVNSLAVEGYANMKVWLAKLIDHMSEILYGRLEIAITAWISAFDSGSSSQPDQTDLRELTILNTADIPQIAMEVSLRDQIIHLDPPIEYVRATWCSSLNDLVQTVCGLRQPCLLEDLALSSSAGLTHFDSFTAILSKAVSPLLERAHDLLHDRVSEIKSYFGDWLRFQSLWDLQPQQVWSYIGDDIDRWLRLSSEIRRSRTTFDTSCTSISFGRITINYEAVQSRVNAKYDSWQRDISSKFANVLQGHMNELYTRTKQMRLDLESKNMDSSSTESAVAFILAVQACKDVLPAWGSDVERYRIAQTVLLKQRQSLSPDSLNAEVLVTEFSSLQDIFRRKTKIATERLNILRTRIQSEDNSLQNHVKQLISQWETIKPVNGDAMPPAALKITEDYQSRFGQATHAVSLMHQARKAVELPSSTFAAMQDSIEEVANLAEVWASVHTVWSTLDDLRQTLWAAVVPRKVRANLEGLMSSTRELPTRLRQYEAFEHLQSRLVDLSKMSTVITLLKSDAVRERHWQKLLKHLSPQARVYYSSLTLGDVWDLQLVKNDEYLRSIVHQAEGELAIEEYLREIRDLWGAYGLDLINYRNKCRLIKGWDELFALCSEHLVSLAAMKNSPYHKVFEDEAESWESRLTRMHFLFDVWIDVQRQWVYLEGIFSNSADIKALLPTESTRFQNINGEFYALMRKVAKAPAILDVLNIAGVQQTVDRLAEALQKIQKALGEYLERERIQFPRFYFIGDEDLLEVIGNTSDLERLQRHMQKMFPGVHRLVIAGDNSTILGITSREEEVVQFISPVKLTNRKVNEWLMDLVVEIKKTLQTLVARALFDLQKLCFSSETRESESRTTLDWLNDFPAQALVLAVQCDWTSKVDSVLREGLQLSSINRHLQEMLDELVTFVLANLQLLTRIKIESLLTELVYQQGVIKKMIASLDNMERDFIYNSSIRYYHSADDRLGSSLLVHMADATFEYGFEYLGASDKLVQTTLTHRCFLTLTQALKQRLGGSPFGPAGTGKTETVKALGHALGRFVVVFCCDESFDFKAMGRILLGLCRVGAWGCFDEFNRLEETILSAVSQQIQSIQIALKHSSSTNTSEVELMGRSFRINPDTGIFITMNPGYAGRSHLPTNLTKLFRSVAMAKPDKEAIAEVTFYTQGFRDAQALSFVVVMFFNACMQGFSAQSHYDFGLRALKSVLNTCGNLKRAEYASVRAQKTVLPSPESEIVLRSLKETILPKLVGSDSIILEDILLKLFPGIQYHPTDSSALHDAAEKCTVNTALTLSHEWFVKLMQLQQVLTIHHGVILVGAAGSGKSQTWLTLSKALSLLENIEVCTYIIDAKVMSKDALYGKLDATTREWNDGLFTSILRRIVDNLRGEDKQRHWIVFDGDVDPVWVENMNSLLDDNKLLTLPNGERIRMPSNVRLLFETDNLDHATPATVSRCGMVYFDEDSVLLTALCQSQMYHLQVSLAHLSDGDELSASIDKQSQVVLSDVVRPFFGPQGLVQRGIPLAKTLHHIMPFSRDRALVTLMALLASTCRGIAKYDAQHSDFPLSQQQIEDYISAKIVIHLIWSFAGDCPVHERAQFGAAIASMEGGTASTLTQSIIDYNVTLPDSVWSLWEEAVPAVDIEPNMVMSTTLVVPTVDTIRHEDLLYSWLAEHRSCILCGPPGSGKTMSLLNALRKLPFIETVGLNFSSATTPELILKTLEQYCVYNKTLNGIRIAPSRVGQWLVLFCDEINLPSPDIYGTQRVIFFLRQLIERQGFWRSSDKQWVSIERIQIVGACNPPTDVGRNALSDRFLRHVPVILVGYPTEVSLRQIYSTYMRAVLKFAPSLRGYTESLTNAMILFYTESSKHFTIQSHAHYIYSPRELSRWVKGIAEAIHYRESISLGDLVRVWAHEALRLFADRLVTMEEREWTEELLHRLAKSTFPGLEVDDWLQKPILYSSWLSTNYVPVSPIEIRNYIRARMKTFCEEEVDVPLVPFDEVIEHSLQVDRVFRQPQGHLILIGISGSGKTTLTKFVAWLNGLKTYQIKIHGNYTAADFDDDLRELLRRCGTKGEKICFLLDESNVLDAGFLERMNTLLANAEIPGLFEGEEFTSLLSACKDGAHRDGVVLDSQEELYGWFTQQIVHNLHVVFTMNPPSDLAATAATSPALFNRCVLNWFGDWSRHSMTQVAREFTDKLDIDRQDYVCPDTSQQMSYRDAVIEALVTAHIHAQTVNLQVQTTSQTTSIMTPRHFLDMVEQFIKCLNEKQSEIEDNHRHLAVGLEKLHNTVEEVDSLQKSLETKQILLEAKNVEANEKLKNMVAGQQEAEQQRLLSVKLQRALVVQEEEIAERQSIVKEDLSQAEPAVIEAQRAVSNIKKQQLTEVRSMGNPPEPVKIAMQAVCTLLGHKADNWKSVQSVVRREDFISSIVRFDNQTQMPSDLRRVLRRDYLDLPSFQYEVVNRASKACGPLVQWVVAQVSFSEILDKVGPLRLEVQRLKEDAVVNRDKARSMDLMIKNLQESIAIYKNEYAELISLTQSLKQEMHGVEAKVKRSHRLIDSLKSERTRWTQSGRAFEDHLHTVVGDSLLAAAALAYSGNFDQAYRQSLRDGWESILARFDISFNDNVSWSSQLADADKLLNWHTAGLSADELSAENALILDKCIRYPLIIDPTGRACEFLAAQYTQRKLSVTSFLDASFVKHLETALRFGGAILIQDAEHIDPILNKVLNREYYRNGGRTLVGLGKQEIDISPTFKLYLSTRATFILFSPDICSKVTFVNFTVTSASLEIQTLNTVLSSERPEIESQRADAQRTQRNLSQSLRRLEKELLQALNRSHGNLLDDDTIVSTLEELKEEADKVAQGIVRSDDMIATLSTITKEYDDVAKAIGRLFIVLHRLVSLNHFYRFSLAFLEDVLHHVLAKAKNNPAASQAEQIRRIIRDLYIETFRYARPALLHKDQPILALSLAIAFLLDTDGLTASLLISASGLFDPEADTPVAARVERLAAVVPSLGLEARIKQNPEIWINLQSNIEPLTAAKEFLSGIEEPLNHIFLLVIISNFRPEHLVPSINAILLTAMGEALLDQPETDFSHVVQTTVSSVPIMLASTPGYDAAFQVENLVKQLSKHCTVVALGSEEGNVQANRAIMAASTAGEWVLIKNVHLAIPWLDQLEKRMHSLPAHEAFRLFLTSELSLKIPGNLIRLSRSLIFESAPGIRSNILQSAKRLTQAETERGPVERVRLYFLLAWLHAIIQERLHYPGHGWSKSYEFNESDFESSRSVIDAWLGEYVSKTNIDPSKIPWVPIKTLLKQTIYGGRIEAEVDQLTLDLLVDKYITHKAYDIDFRLVETATETLTIPDVKRMPQFLDWVHTLPERQPPTWLGLREDAQRMFLEKQAYETIQHVKHISNDLFNKPKYS